MGWNDNHGNHPVGFLWNAAGEKLQEVPGLLAVNADSRSKVNNCPIADAQVFSPDGSRFLSVNQAANFSVSIRSTQSFTSLCDLGDHGAVRGASFDESGSRVLTSSKTSELTI